ncbi:preprotein translocase subunit SecE [Mycolicibacterium sp. XJ1819]
MSDSEPAGRRSTGAETDDTTDGSSAIVTRPTRPTGKRSRRSAVGEDAGDAVDLATGTKAAPTKNGAWGTKKTAKKRGDDGGGRRNPITLVWNYLMQVVAELRKVIWPNRNQMVNYTIVVLVFLAFMVALIAAADYGLARLVGLVFG